MNQCPHCQHELTPKEIAVLYAGLRKNNRGGRPLKPRCACGKFTVSGAELRAHVCGHANRCPCELCQKAMRRWKELKGIVSA